MRTDDGRCHGRGSGGVGLGLRSRCYGTCDMAERFYRNVGGDFVGYVHPGLTGLEV